MYAHTLIEDLQRYIDYYEIGIPVANLKNLPELIRNAQKFHLGSVAEYENLSKPYAGTSLFRGDNGGVRLPYPRCYFDWHRYEAENNDIRDYPTAPSFKRAILCHELDAKTFIYFCFNHFHEVEEKRINGTVLKHYNLWQPSEVGGLALIDSTLGDNPTAQQVFYSLAKSHHLVIDEAQIRGFINKDCVVNSLPMPLSPKVGSNPDLVWRLHQENMDEVTVLNTALKILSCNNVGTKVNQPPARLNKKRMKKNKPPIFSYRTLTIKTGTGGNSTTDPKGLWENPVHLCRGHFKTYTEENPLFGRVVGRYWWQPQVRGHKKQGVVIKDYQIA